MHTRTAPKHIATSPVTSSAIAAIGHDPATKTLRIEFTSGGTYDYQNVSTLEHEKLLAAKSIGKHFIDTFKLRNKFTRHA